MVTVLGSLHALTFNQLISLGVLATGAITMVVNWYYKRENLKLEKQKLQHSFLNGENSHGRKNQSQ
nr:HP1 family phage holin [Pseudomaricurvus alkylphenolicus]